MQVPGSIAKYRNELGWKQTYVASKLDMTQQAYSDLELSKTNLTEERALQIAVLFKIDVLLIYRPDQQHEIIHTTLDENIKHLYERLKDYVELDKAKDKVIEAKNEVIDMKNALLKTEQELNEVLKEELRREREKKRK
jgi:transcriptional regulator with XRE-family HTH domain